MSYDADGEYTRPQNRETIQIHIEADTDEVEQLAGFAVEISEGEAYTDAPVRELYLARGGDIETQDDQPMTIYGTDDGQILVFGDHARAVGYFLYACETNGIPQMEAYSAVEDHIEPYEEMVGLIGHEQRRELLMGYADWRVENGDWMVDKYLQDDAGCSWRERGLTDSAASLRDDIIREIDHQPRMCYYTAQQAALLHAENHRVEYAEGLALPQQASQAIRHAWIEIDGIAVEVTWPWHVNEHWEPVYYGRTYDAETVRETRERRDETTGLNGALIADDEELAEVTNAKG